MLRITDRAVEAVKKEIQARPEPESTVLRVEYSEGCCRVGLETHDEGDLRAARRVKGIPVIMDSVSRINLDGFELDYTYGAPNGLEKPGFRLRPGGR
ncbi:MAG: hypothetical protein ABII00_16695 [Elusimicrobiota bacterium]